MQAISVNRVGQSNRYSGVWRAGSDNHALWLSEKWPGFMSKWKELSERGMRLTNFVHVADSVNQTVDLSNESFGLVSDLTTGMDSKGREIGSDANLQFGQFAGEAVGNGGGLLLNPGDRFVVNNGDGEFLFHPQLPAATGNGGGLLANEASNKVTAGEGGAIFQTK